MSLLWQNGRTLKKYGKGSSKTLWRIKNGREEKAVGGAGGRGEGRRTGEVCSAGGLGEENHRKETEGGKEREREREE